MVGIARFELATFCPPDKRAKPSCAISRSFYKYTITFGFCKFYLQNFAFFITSTLVQEYIRNLQWQKLCFLSVRYIVLVQLYPDMCGDGFVQNKRIFSVTLPEA